MFNFIRGLTDAYKFGSYFGKGLKLYGKGKYNKALEYLLICLDFNTQGNKDIVVRQYISYSYEKLNQKDNALKHAKIGIEHFKILMKPSSAEINAKNELSRLIERLER